jgi:hypothetical protein
VRFVSIQADPPGTDDGSNDSLNQEWVLLKNFSSHAVKMGSYGVEVGNVRGCGSTPARARTAVTTSTGTVGVRVPEQADLLRPAVGPGGIQNGVHVAELEDTCFVLTNVNGAC